MLRILALILTFLATIHRTAVQEIVEEPTIVASTNGIAFKTHPAVCLPSIFRTIQINLEYNYLAPLTEELFKLKQAFGKYGNAKDSQNSINIRVCTANDRSNGICPLTSLKAINEELAKDRNMFVEMFLDCKCKINYLQKILSEEFPSNAYLPLLKLPTSQIMFQLPAGQTPLIDNLQLEQQQAVFLPIHDIRKPTLWNKVFITFRKKGDNFWFPKSTRAINFTAIMQDLIRDAQIAITHTNMLLDELLDIFQNLKDHQFPLALVEESSLPCALETIRSQHDSLLHTKDEDFSMMTQKPLTYAVQDSRCQDNDNQDCEGLEVISIFPVLKTTDQFKLKETITFPVATETYSEHPKWEKTLSNIIKQQPKILVRNTELFTTNNDFSSKNCPIQVKCKVCNFQSLPQILDDDCLAKILQGQTGLCETKPINPPVDRAIQLDENSWMIVDPQPGLLVQSCGMNEKVFHLPFSGIINFKNHSNYRMINGLFSCLVPYLPIARISAAQSAVFRLNRTKNILNDISSMQRHF